MLVFAFLPENVFHVLAIALALCILEEGIYQLRQARRPSQPASEQRALLVQGSCAVVAGIGIAILGLVANAEPPCGGCGHGHWGGTFGLVILVVMLALFVIAKMALWRQR